MGVPQRALVLEMDFLYHAFSFTSDAAMQLCASYREERGRSTDDTIRGG